MISNKCEIIFSKEIQKRVSITFLNFSLTGFPTVCLFQAITAQFFVSFFVSFFAATLQKNKSILVFFIFVQESSGIALRKHFKYMTDDKSSLHAYLTSNFIFTTIAQIISKAMIQQRATRTPVTYVCVACDGASVGI